MIRKLALTCCALALSLAAAELAVRLLLPQASSWLAIYRTHPELPIFSVDADLERFVDTGESAWTVYTDGTGSRTAAPDRRPARTREDALWVIGDSFTFGNGVDHEQTFVGLLDAAAGPAGSFVNCGTPGYGPRQYLLRLTHRLAHEPPPRAVLVCCYLGNDFQDTLWDKPVDPGEGKSTEPPSLKGLLKRSSHLYRLTSKVWHRVRPTREDRVWRELFSATAWEGPFLSRAAERFGEAMGAVVGACRASAVPLVIALVPPEYTVRGATAGDSDRDPALPVERATALLAELEVRVVDLTPALDAVGADDAYWPLDGHLSPAGHRAVADALAPLLVELVAGGTDAQSSPR
jgi:lysophospholipase L1-like esterase